MVEITDTATDVLLSNPTIELRNKLKDPSFLPHHDDVAKMFESNEEWSDYCFNKEHPVYEFLNQEYIRALAKYLSDRIDAIQQVRRESLLFLK